MQVPQAKEIAKSCRHEVVERRKVATGERRVEYKRILETGTVAETQSDKLDRRAHQGLKSDQGVARQLRGPDNWKKAKDPI